VASGDSREDKSQALVSIYDFIKLLITLATGTVVFSATFLDSFYKDRGLSLLIISWVLMVVSVVFGLFAAGQYIRQLDRSDLTVRRGKLEVFSVVQIASLAVAVLLFLVFALTNVTGGDV
jgi:hypothetical protein